MKPLSNAGLVTDLNTAAGDSFQSVIHYCAVLHVACCAGKSITTVHILLKETFKNTAKLF